MAHKEKSDLKAKLDLLALLVLPDQKVLSVLADQRVLSGLLVPKDPLDLLDLLVHKDFKAKLVPLVPLVLSAHKAQLDLLAHKEFRAYREILDRRDRKENKVPPCRRSPSSASKRWLRSVLSCLRRLSRSRSN